ncbi:MAG: NADH:ubiquinone oxidoreductase, Na translocating, B subunit [Clostridiales bacterium]|nr:MAG: NADH:ubiquinone oxidoreductase, Na translocating, B subunit [Clostridiales bacterium]
MAELYKKHFMKQKMMERMLWALAPAALGSVWFFGLRALLVMGVSVLFACFAEWLFVRKNGGRISEAALVTGLIFALSMPPKVPLWIVALGISFGMVFGKMAFGGFGTNLFNPAIAARAFVYISFSKPINADWTGVATGAFGGFSKFLGPDIQAVSSATPLLAFKNTGEVFPYMKLILGNVSGSMGETSAVLILIGAAYLIKTKSADWRLMAGMATGFFTLSAILSLLQPELVANPIYGALSGSFLFTMVFIVTEPISAPKTSKGKFIYGMLAGVVVVIIRGYALFTEGTTFAILVANTFGPLVDEGVRHFEKREKKVIAS